jgi:hypothetical protein
MQQERNSFKAGPSLNPIQARYPIGLLSLSLSHVPVSTTSQDELLVVASFFTFS